MASIIKIKHGNGRPTVLQPNELGFDTTNKVLYIGTAKPDGTCGDPLALNNAGGALKLPLPISQGGTGQQSAIAGFNALASNYIELSNIGSSHVKVNQPLFFNDNEFLPFYTKNDRIPLAFHTAGYISSGGLDVRFTLPINRQIPANLKPILDFNLTDTDKAALYGLDEHGGFGLIPSEVEKFTTQTQPTKIEAESYGAAAFPGGIVVRQKGAYWYGSKFGTGEFTGDNNVPVSHTIFSHNLVDSKYNNTQRQIQLISIFNAPNALAVIIRMKTGSNKIKNGVESKTESISNNETAGIEIKGVLRFEERAS